MNSITPTAPSAMKISEPPFIWPLWVSDSIWLSAGPRRATMPAKIRRLMPLPTPRLVICSPSHIRNMVPPVRVAMVETMKNGPGSNTRVFWLCRPKAIAPDWNSASTTVR